MKELPINFEQPLWLLLFVILVALTISVFLYYRNSRHEFSSNYKVLFFILRFLSVFILGVLLLNPFLIKKTKHLEKPMIVLALDESESMLLHYDSSVFTEEMEKTIQNISSKLSNHFNIDFVSFQQEVGSDKEISFTGKRTDISQMLNYVEDKYYMLNLSAIVLLSDGNYNQGKNPSFVMQNSSVEIFPVIYGDTSAKQELFIDDLYFNKIIKQGGSFPLEVIVQANGLKNKKLKIRVDHHQIILKSKTVDISNDVFNSVVNFQLEPKGEGLQKYIVRLLIEGEQGKQKEIEHAFYVQIVKTGNKILLLGKAPHPDLGAMASALRKITSYQVDIKTLHDYPFDISNYQLVVLHSLPVTDKRSVQLFEQKGLDKKALWYVISPQTDFTLLSNQNIPWKISKPQGGFEYAQAKANADFSSFKMSKYWIGDMDDFPPLYVPFSSYESNTYSQVMLWQKIKGYETHKPLQFFWQKGNVKYTLLAGEGLWKWRLHNYKNQGNFDNFDAFIQRTAKYLLTGTHNDRFNIQYNNIYNETDKVEWQAEVYNANFELISDADVNLQLKDEQNHIYEYALLPQEEQYSVNLGHLSPGIYVFEAKAITKDTILYKKGKFVVDTWDVESNKKKANVELLSNLASKSNGQTYYPSQLEELIDTLNNRPDFKERASYIQNLIHLIDTKALVFVLLLLLSLEWVLRKREGHF